MITIIFSSLFRVIANRKTTKMNEYSLTLWQRVYEVELHYKRPLFDGMFFITSANDALLIIRECIHPMKMDLQESFWVLYLTQANGLLGVSKTGEGSTIGVMVNIKAVFQIALRLNASRMILVHNHPSGNLNPSETDKKVTKKLLDLSKIMEVTLLDHIIVTSESYFSFQHEGLL